MGEERTTLECLIKNPPRPYENTITLGPVGFTLAQGVYHPATPWSLKEANQFMATHLKLDTQQDAQLNSDLQQENFLSEYEKLPQLQAIFNYKKRQQAAAVTLRTAQVLLFCLADKLGDAKHELQSTVEACGAVVANPSNERSSRATYGPERFPLGLRPLVSDPKVEVALKTRFDVDDLGLNDEQLAALESRFKALHAENQGRCHAAAKKASTAIHTLYGSAAELHNSISDSLRTYTRLFSVHDLSIWRLIRAKMANIFRPSFRKAIMNGSCISSVGIFGGEDSQNLEV